MNRFSLLTLLLLPLCVLAAPSTLPLRPIESTLAVLESAVTNVKVEDLAVTYRRGQQIEKRKGFCVKNIGFARKSIATLRRQESLEEAVQLALVLSDLNETLETLADRLAQVESPANSASIALTWAKALDSAQDNLYKVAEPFNAAVLKHAAAADRVLSQ